jgi:hypothetical protein
MAALLERSLAAEKILKQQVQSLLLRQQQD